MPGKAFVDTNVLVYAHDSETPEKKIKAQALLFDGLRHNSAAISAQVLSEFFVTITRKVKRPMPEPQAAKEISLLANLEVVDIDVQLIQRAIAIKQRWQLGYWDGLIVAAAERAHCHTLYSEDLSDGQSYGEVTVRNPFA